MIDEKRLIKTLEEWKSEVSDVVGLRMMTFRKLPSVVKRVFSGMRLAKCTE